MPVSNVGLENTNGVNFKSKKVAQTTPKTEPYPEDTVEISGKKVKKKQKSRLKKWAKGLGITFGAFIGAAIIAMGADKRRITKLYKEKLVLSNLPEKINFKEAKTLDEAIKFAKETLGIKEIDQGFTLEALNTANRGLTDVSNAHKGKLFIPKRLGFKELTGDDATVMAFVVPDINTKYFGDLVLNKNYFNDNFLNKCLEKELFFKSGKPLYELNDSGNLRACYIRGSIVPHVKGELENLIKKFYKDKSSLSIAEKQKLFYSMENIEKDAGRTKRSPMETLRNLVKNNQNILKANHINIDIAEAEKMTTEKQQEYLKDIINRLNKHGVFFSKHYDVAQPTYAIHHEMGHLQDFAKNLKELHIKQNFGESFQQIRERTKNGIKQNRSSVYEVDNRWGTTDRKYLMELKEKNPEKFKKWYPDFYEFITNQEIQQTAGKVSGYSQIGIGEFIAETYARMVEGKEIPKDVMALYRRYKGPEFV